MTEGSRERPPAPSAERLGEPEAGAGAEPERSGPLAVERYRKADGRPLILFRRLADDG
jgi:hypothetical protein